MGSIASNSAVATSTFERVTAMTFIPNASARSATAAPMRP